MNNTWEPVIIKTHRGKKSAFASVGQGRIRFSQFACDLIYNYHQYNYAKVGRKQTEKELLYCFEFIKDDEGEGSYTLSRRRQKNGKGKTVETGGCEISNKALVVNLFGQSALGKTKPYDVTIEGDNMLIVHVPA